MHALVDSLRAGTAGEPLPGAPPFVRGLADEVTRLFELSATADRLLLLAHVTSELTAPATPEDIADVVLRVARESLGALSARVMVVDGDALVTIASYGVDPPGTRHTGVCR